MTSQSSGASQPAEFKCDLCGKVCQRAYTLTRHKDSNVCKAEQARQARRPAQPTSSNNPENSLPTNLPDLLLHSKKNRPTLRRIPAGAREACADSLTRTLTQCGDGNGIESWKDLILFAPRMFHAPSEKKSDRLATKNKNNLQGIVIAGPGPRKQKPRKSTDDAIRKQIDLKFQDGDISGAVRLLASEDTIAPANEETLAALKLKHPSPPRDLVFPEVTLAPCGLDITVEEVSKALQSFSAGSGAGPDGMRPQHLKDLVGIRGETGAKFLTALCKTVNRIVNSDVPKEAAAVLFGANLTPLRKKDGGIRPIASGSVFRRLAGKIVSRRIQAQLGEVLRPVQLGYGTKGGCEIAVHATRAFLEVASNETRCLLKLDFKNAFNTIRRDRMLEKVKEVIPEYHPYVSSTYLEPSILFCGDETILSNNGVQQGDPLGPMLFCLVVDELAQSLDSPLNVWYLDDATLGGSPESVLENFTTVMEKADELGLELNASKCELLMLGGSEDARKKAATLFRATAPEIGIVKPEDLELLGAPLLGEAVTGALRKKIGQAQVLSGRLGLLPAHQALFILKNCLALPKLCYILRSSECWRYKEALDDFDETIRMALESVTNVPMTAGVWNQSSLPTSHGGLGIPKSADVALAAYIASLEASTDMVTAIVTESRLPEKIVALTERWQTETGLIAPPDQEDRKKQASWSKLQASQKAESILENADVISRSRLLAASSTESAAWLSALPVATIGNLLDDSSLRIAVGLRLGAAICTEHTCICGQQVDKYGHHGLACKKSRGRFARHSSLNDAIQRSLGSAHITSVLEPVGLDRGDGKRPDGLTISPWRFGKALVWDVTVVDTLAQSYVAATSQLAGSAADAAEARKQRKYEALEQQFIVQPIGFETMGSWGTGAKAFLTEVGNRVKQATGNQRAMEFLRQRVSIEIQRGNAASVIGTAEHPKDWSSLFLLS